MGWQITEKGTAPRGLPEPMRHRPTAILRNAEVPAARAALPAGAQTPALCLIESHFGNTLHTFFALFTYSYSPACWLPVCSALDLPTGYLWSAPRASADGKKVRPHRCRWKVLSTSGRGDGDQTAQARTQARISRASRA